MAERGSPLRLIRCLALLAVCAALAFPALAARPYAADEIRARDGFPQCLTAPNRGTLRYFAQNDPVWATMTYRYPHFENEPRFSGAGCVPSTIANCVVNLLPPEALPAIDRYSWRGEGFPICPCSMNLYDCDGTHDRFRIRQAADFERYFCLVIGAYMSGNNSEHALVCGTLSMTDELCGIYGLRCERAESMTAAAEAVARGALAVMMVGGEDCPLTKSGHALLLCDVDEDDYYFLDSFRHEAYEDDALHIVRVVQPGLIAVSRRQAYRLGAYQIIIVYPPEPVKATAGE